jgi:hypothetical protein
VQIRALAREIVVRPRRRILGSFASSSYVEEPSDDFSCESAEMYYSPCFAGLPVATW